MLGVALGKAPIALVALATLYVFLRLHLPVVSAVLEIPAKLDTVIAKLDNCQGVQAVAYKD